MVRKGNPAGTAALMEVNKLADAYMKKHPKAARQVAMRAAGAEYRKRHGKAGGKSGGKSKSSDTAAATTQTTTTGKTPVQTRSQKAGLQVGVDLCNFLLVAVPARCVLTPQFPISCPRRLLSHFLLLFSTVPRWSYPSLPQTAYST